MKVPLETKGGLMGGLKSERCGVSGRVQQEVLEMLTGDTPLTIKQIANRRQTSVQAVYRIVWKLKEQGKLQGNSYGGFNSEHTARAGGFNLHSQRFRIGIIDFVTTYAKQQYLQKVGNNGIDFKGNTIKLRPKCIEIYSNSAFQGDSVASCDQAATSYWQTYLDALQGKYGVVVLKHKRNNIQETYCHIAMLQNGIAYNQNVKRDRIFYFDQETGKLWCQTDRSHLGNDLEFEGATARVDSQLFEKHLVDWRNPNQATPGQMQDIVFGLTKVVTMLVPHLPQETMVQPKKDRELPSYFG